jgi:hypothetical protein
MATLPAWMDLEFVKATTAVLAVVSLILAVVIVCSVRSVGTRLVAVGLLGAAIFGLMQYRDTLDTCDKRGCACTFLGEDLEGGGCARE